MAEKKHRIIYRFELDKIECNGCSEDLTNEKNEKHNVYLEYKGMDSTGWGVYECPRCGYKINILISGKYIRRE